MKIKENSPLYGVVVFVLILVRDPGGGLFVHRVKVLLHCIIVPRI